MKNAREREENVIAMDGERLTEMERFSYLEVMVSSNEGIGERNRE